VKLNNLSSWVDAAFGNLASKKTKLNLFELKPQ